MTRNTRSHWIDPSFRRLLYLLSMALLGALTLSCDTDDGRREANLGQVRLSLRGAAPDGTEYNLERARFVIRRGPEEVDLDGDTADTVLVVDLPMGAYTIQLLDGWVMHVRELGHDWEPVEAVLVPPNPAPLMVEDQMLTDVVFRFQVDDQVIQMGYGRVRITIEVEEVGGGGPCTPEPEICDGQDNDCDGEVDEALVLACYDGPAGTADVGMCRMGMHQCTDGLWGPCVGQVLPEPELCDARDNDCDGRVDNDLLSVCYQGPPGTAGVGECREGTRQCIHGAWGMCEDQVHPQPEICDGRDNDCNGEIDEGVCEGLCGDGIVDAAEECDDGNLRNGDGCSNVCFVEHPTCGNGVVEAGEACDDGNLRDGDGCNHDCLIEDALCGNGIIEPDEACDDGPDNSDVHPDACRLHCMPAMCGDGIVDSGETCDEGPDNSNDISGACRLQCMLAMCGDGVVDPGEACDEGPDNSDFAPSACRTRCEQAMCGDGVVDEGEMCDDGDMISDHMPDACRTDCQAPRCGDGVIDSGEMCDDGDMNSDVIPDICRTNCIPPICGDGVVDLPEMCDDGNGVDGDGCSAACIVE